MILGNDRLRVEVADPGTIYRGARFDWSGFITQVTLDGVHTFCAPESLRAGEGTGGIGLCNEFGIHRPIGYDDARLGGQFPKLGVGLLTRPDENAYSFFAPYKIEPFPLRIKKEGDRAAFEFDSLPCRGYEARLRKAIQVRGAALDIFYELENTGTRAIRTHEYNHNFVVIDGCPSGPGYRLRLAKEMAFASISPLLSVEGRDVRWREKVPGPFYCPASGSYEQMDGPFWELTHEPGGAGMRESVSVPAEHFALWCAPHVISPEVFVTIDLKPGVRMTWARHYEFFSDRRG